MEFTAAGPHDLAPAAAALAEQLRSTPVAAFRGAMGVGKTTFIKALCAQLGVSDPVNSPSFALVNEYLGSSGQSIYHFDLYRLKSPEELFDIGGDEYFYSGNICLIEWPEKAGEQLPEERIDVHMEEGPDGRRNIRF